MNASIRKIVGAAAVIALSLASSLATLAAEPSGTPADASAFARGATVWANNCVRCHNARDPKDFRDDQWKVIMSHMRIRASLTGQEARDVLGFLQQSNAPALAPDGSGRAPMSTPAAGRLSGQALFENTCVACHGVDGKGTIPGVPDLAVAGGRLAQPDRVLIRHVLDGFQSAGSAMAMPPKGGNPGLTEADMAALLAYMRSTFKP